MNLNTDGPSYDNNIVTLMQFLKSVINRESRVLDPPQCLEQTQIIHKIQAAKNIILMVVDGMGYNYISSKPELVCLNQHLIGSMDSVFPTSTAAAIPSFLSGVSPAQHGVFGWFQWLPEVGILAKSLPFRSRTGNIDLRAAGVRIEDCLDFPSFFEDITIKSYSHGPDFITDEPFNVYATRGSERVSYDTPARMLSKLASACQRGSGQQYHYVYYPFFDSSCHAHGLHSDKTLQEAISIDAFVARLKQNIGGEETIVILTADHGMLDIPTEKQLCMNDYPTLTGLMSGPLSGEPRVSYCSVRSEHKKEFEKRFQSTLGDFADLIEPRKLMANCWFGFEKAWTGSGIQRSLCDYVILMKDHYTLVDQLPGEGPHQFIGMHGGVTKDEMRVPLVLL